MLKAFFPKRGKGSVWFVADVTLHDLEKAGIHLAKFTKELKIVHLKNSPM